MYRKQITAQGNTNTHNKNLKSWLFAALLSVQLSAGLYALPAQAQTVRQPNGEYTETVEDLKVKVLGGEVKLARSWLNGRWYINPAWATLRFIADPLDNSIKAIDRSGSIYTRSGTSEQYIFDTVLIQKTDSGWRWKDQVGNWITYDQAGRITAYGDKNNISVTDHLGQSVVSFTYQNDRLTQIQDRAGRSISYTWEGDRLKSVSHLGGANGNTNTTPTAKSQNAPTPPAPAPK